MQISQTFWKNLLVQSHQIASEKTLTDKTLSPGTLSLNSYYKNTWDESFGIDMFPFIDTLHTVCSSS